MALYTADFSGAVDAAPSGWTPRWTTTNSTWLLRAKGLPFQVLEHTTTASARRLLSWDTLDADADRADAEVLALIRSSSTLGFQTQVHVRGAGAASSEASYYVTPDGTTGFKLYKVVAGTATQLGSTLTTPAVVVDTWYWVRLRANSTAIKAKVWRDGEAEPASWGIEVTDSAVAAAGWIGVGANQSTGTRDFAYVAVGTAGDSPAVPTVNPRFYHAATETLVQGDPALQLAQTALEFLVGEPLPVNVYQAAVEILVDNSGPAAPPSGGDYVIINVCT